MATTDILGRCKAIPERQYGTRFKGLLLYGSVARDQADSASDVDLLVLLSGQFDYFDELRRIIDVLYPLQLDSDRLISA
jgi:predicted nucleotidyltransferase